MAVISLSAAFRPGGPRPSVSQRPGVAHISVATGAVQLRAADTLGWRTVARGDAVHELESLYIPPGSEAQVQFVDGTLLDLDERSLVVIEPSRPTGRAVTVRQGSLASSAGSKSLTLATAQGTTTLPPQATARLEVHGAQTDVQVTRGAATVVAKGTSTDVEAGRRASVTDAVSLMPEWPVTLLAPPPAHRQLFRGQTPKMVLQWGEVPQGARLQTARDRLFAFVTLDLPARGGSQTLGQPSPGVTWWRVVDANGQPVSESRRFSFVEDVAPAPRLPRPGQVVLAPRHSALEFAWTPLPGVNHYRLEVSATASFESNALDQTVAGTQAKVPSPLTEGIWYWRVRAADDAREDVVACEPVRFRVIEKPIPDAPELFTPEIEVTPARAP